MLKITDIRSTDWYTDTNQDGDIIDVSLTSFQLQLQRTATSLVDLLPKAIYKPYPYM